MLKYLAFFLLLLATIAACSANDSATPTGSGLTYVTVTPIPPTPSPTPVFTRDLSPFYPTLKPGFQTELDAQAALGITRYQIAAQLLPASLTPPADPRLQGTMQVQYTNRETVLLNQIYLRLFPNTVGYGGAMNVSRVIIAGQAVQTTLLANNSALFVPLPRALEPGQTVELSLDYDLQLPTSTGPGSGLLGYDQTILSLAGFYPTIPVFDQQGWHLEEAPHFVDAVYTDVALYEVSLTLPANLVAVTSGSIVQTTPNPDGSQTVRALGGPMRDFFIALSPNYQTLSREQGGTLINSTFLSGYQAQGEAVLEIGINALATFESLFGPYPYREFDLVAVPVPLTLGGVEYPGLIAMAARYYSQDDTFLEFVTVHEVAHQWWYGLVGNDQVTHPWLDEALTQYSVIHYYEAVYGPQRRAEIIAEMFSPFYWQLQNTGGNRPVYGPAAGFDELLYYPVVYGKGPLFFEAVRNRLGDEGYLAALRYYAQTYRYGLATPRDLLQAFEQVGGQSVEDLYQEWIIEP